MWWICKEAGLVEGGGQREVMAQLQAKPQVEAVAVASESLNK